MQVQLGNDLEVAASDPASKTLLASITEDGATDNQVVVNSVNALQIGMTVDFRVRATGSATGGATARHINMINQAASTVGYDGADVDIADDSFGIYFAGGYAESAGYNNVNGGAGVEEGFRLLSSYDLGSLRNFLIGVNSDTYSEANMDKMTRNDMIYALRMNYAGGKGIESFGLTPNLFAWYGVVTS